MKVDKKRMKELVKFYEGHIKYNVSYRTCGNTKKVTCPIHTFFMEMKKEVKGK
jgi:hypothetical protein